MRSAGFNVEAGTLLLAVVERTDEGPANPIQVSNARLEPAALPEAESLRDLSERVKQELEAAGVNAVGLVHTRAFRNLQYNVVYPRVAAICAVMFAAAELNVSYETLSTESIGAAINCPAKSLKAFNFAALGFEQRPKFWTTGLAEAYAAAVTLVGGTV